MYSLLKFGYLLVGFGIGTLASSFILEHELNKPIGEIEEYIPRENRDNDTEIDQENDSVGRKSNSKDQTDSRKDISSGRNRGGDFNGPSESGSHSEFGASQADLLHFYSSNEDRLRNPEFGKQRAAEKRKGSAKGSGEGEMSEADQRRAEFEKRRAESNKNMSTRYSTMYNDISGIETGKGGDDMNDILHRVNARTNTKESYIQDEDGPDDIDEDYLLDDMDPFEIDIHKEHTLEPIEGVFEVFLNECPLCETIPLTYYAGDYTLCDDGEQIIPDPEDVVGMAALSRLIEGGPGVHDDVIFVHNTRTNLNYEVMLERGTYKESVAGLIDEKFSSRKW